MKKLIFSLQLIVNLLLVNVSGHASSSSAKDPKTCPIILEGYDIVSYYSDSGPKKGNLKFQAVYKEKRYLFSNEKNRMAFSKNPQKYASPNGEHCAYTTANLKGKKVKANPKLFSFSNDQIFFFHNKNVKKKWELNQKDNYRKITKILSAEERQIKKYKNQNNKGVLILSF